MVGNVTNIKTEQYHKGLLSGLGAEKLCGNLIRQNAVVGRSYYSNLMSKRKKVETYLLFATKIYQRILLYN